MNVTLSTATSHWVCSNLISGNIETINITLTTNSENTKYVVLATA